MAPGRQGGSVDISLGGYDDEASNRVTLINGVTATFREVTRRQKARPARMRPCQRAVFDTGDPRFGRSFWRSAG